MKIILFSMIVVVFFWAITCIITVSRIEHTRKNSWHRTFVSEIFIHPSPYSGSYCAQLFISPLLVVVASIAYCIILSCMTISHWLIGPLFFGRWIRFGKYYPNEKTETGYIGALMSLHEIKMNQRIKFANTPPVVWLILGYALYITFVAMNAAIDEKPRFIRNILGSIFAAVVIWALSRPTINGIYEKVLRRKLD